MIVLLQRMINVQFLYICLCFAGTKANELYSAKLHRASFNAKTFAKPRHGYFRSRTNWSSDHWLWAGESVIMALNSFQFSKPRAFPNTRFQLAKIWPLTCFANHIFITKLLTKPNNFHPNHNLQKKNRPKSKRVTKTCREAEVYNEAHIPSRCNFCESLTVSSEILDLIVSRLCVCVCLKCRRSYQPE